MDTVNYYTAVSWLYRAWPRQYSVYEVYLDLVYSWWRCGGFKIVYKRLPVLQGMACFGRISGTTWKIQKVYGCVVFLVRI